jgi:NAD(P)-dependent dehydrogenase (short-subunit alcohol dehydrogenase family)
VSFENKVVSVTGAANGIGKGIASLYASIGAIVAVADLR